MELTNNEYSQEVSLEELRKLANNLQDLKNNNVFASNKIEYNQKMEEYYQKIKEYAHTFDYLGDENIAFNLALNISTLPNEKATEILHILTNPSTDKEREQKEKMLTMINQSKERMVQIKEYLDDNQEDSKIL